MYIYMYICIYVNIHTFLVSILCGMIGFETTGWLCPYFKADQIDPERSKMGNEGLKHDKILVGGLG